MVRIDQHEHGCILDALNLELRIEGKPSIGMIGGLTGSCDRMFDSSAISMEMNFPGWLGANPHESRVFRW